MPGWLWGHYLRVNVTLDNIYILVILFSLQVALQKGVVFRYNLEVTFLVVNF